MSDLEQGTGEAQFSVNNPLVELGLVDQSGKALPTEDWSPESSASSPTAPAGSTTSGPGTGLDWESPENPYKRAVPTPAQAGQAHLQAQQAQIASEARSMQALLVSQGMHPQMAEAMVSAAANAATEKATREAEHIALMPQVVREAAEKMSREFSLNGVQIDPRDLQDAPTLEAMRERARMLQRTARDTRVETRKQSGADRVEGGPPAGSRMNTDQLSPQQKIALGLAREGGIN